MNVCIAIIFYIFIRFWYVRYNICSPNCDELLRVSRKSAWRKPHFTSGCKLICLCFPVVFPIGMKVGIAYVHIMLLRNCELHKKSAQGRLHFYYGLKWSKFTVPWNSSTPREANGTQLAFMFCSPYIHTVR